MRLRIFAALAVLVPGLGAPAQAVTPIGSPAGGLQAMRELNLIVLGNMTTGHDVEGKTFVAGNLSGGSATFGIGNGAQGATASARRTLTVGGNVTASVNINNGSNGGSGAVATTPGVLVGGHYQLGAINAPGAAIDVGGNLTGGGNINLSNGQVVNVGGSISANVNGSNPSQTVNAGGSINGNANGAQFNRNLGIGWNAASTVQAVAAEAATLERDLLALSASLRDLSLPANPSALTMGSQGPRFDVVDGGHGFALFNISGSALQSGSIAFTHSGGPLPIIVNVSGTSITWTANATGGLNAALNPFIIWNFHEATSLDLRTMVHGSVLAPLARLTNITPIEGSVVARRFDQGGEVHLGTYAGGDEFLGGVIPEPASWMLLIGGFGAVGAMLRRRRRAGAATPVAAAA